MMTCIEEINPICVTEQQFQHTKGDGAQVLTLNFLPFVASIVPLPTTLKCH